MRKLRHRTIKGTCPRSHSWQAAEAGFEPGSDCGRFCPRSLGQGAASQPCLLLLQLGASPFPTVLPPAHLWTWSYTCPSRYMLWRELILAHTLWNPSQPALHCHSDRSRMVACQIPGKCGSSPQTDSIFHGISRAICDFHFLSSFPLRDCRRASPFPNSC